MSEPTITEALQDSINVTQWRRTSQASAIWEIWDIDPDMPLSEFIRRLSDNDPPPQVRFDPEWM